MLRSPLPTAAVTDISRCAVRPLLCGQAEAKPANPFGAGDLAKAAKGLTESKGAEAGDGLQYDKQVADAMATMHTEMDGDIDRIFETLGENPYKAKKYPPADAEEFGRKYATGLYEYIGDKAESKK